MELGARRELDPAEEAEESRLAVRHKPEGLLTRSFQGLVVALGETPPSKAVEGQSGVARGYTAEERGMFEATSSRKAIAAAASAEREKAPRTTASGQLQSVQRAPALDVEEMAAKRAQAKAAALAKPVACSQQDAASVEEDSGSEIEMDMADLDDFEDALDN